VSYFFSEAARVEHLEHVAYYESCQIGLGERYLLAFDAAMGVVCEAPDRYRVESPLRFVNIAYQVFPTTSSIGLWIQTLKSLSLPRIADGRATGWAGFNWSPKSDAFGSAWLRR